MTALDAIVPLASTLVGAGITYWLNVRTRRRTNVEDIFHDAIAAVAVVVASHDYITEVAPWRGATAVDHAAFTAQLGREGNTRYVQAVAAARNAIARASAYRPELARYYRADTGAVYDCADEIIAALRQTAR